MKEDIARLHRASPTIVERWRPLFVSKHKINPLVEMKADILAFQSLAVAPNEFPRIPVSPRGKLDVTQGCASGLGTAEIKSRAIDQELRQVV